MKQKPDHLVSYTLNGSQPVVCSYIADLPYFYSSLTELDRARELMRDVRDELIDCRDILLSEDACYSG